MRTSGRHTLSITLDVGLSNVMDGRRRSAAPTPAAPPPKKQPDAVYLLADTSTVSVTVSLEKWSILTVLHHARPGGGTGAVLSLRGVLLACRCGIYSVSRGPLNYMEGIWPNAKASIPVSVCLALGQPSL